MSERSDELEIASSLQEQANVDGVARARAALVETHPDFDGESCLDCGEKLPDVRIAYKRIRCAPCQTEIERRRKLGWRV